MRVMEGAAGADTYIHTIFIQAHIRVNGECVEPKQKHKTRYLAAKEQKLPSHRRRHFESRDSFRQEEEENDEQEVVSTTRRLPWPHFAAALDCRLSTESFLSVVNRSA